MKYGRAVHIAGGHYSRGGIKFTKEWTPFDPATLTPEQRQQIDSDERLSVVDALPAKLSEDPTASPDQLRAALREKGG